MFPKYFFKLPKSSHIHVLRSYDMFYDLLTCSHIFLHVPSLLISSSVYKLTSNIPGSPHLPPFHVCKLYSTLLSLWSDSIVPVFIDYWVSFPGREATTRSQLESTASEEPTVMNGPMFFSVLPVRTVILKRCAVSYCLWTEDYREKK